MKENEINNLINENEFLKKQLEEQKSSYKQLSSELGQSIFECEDLDKENRKLKKEIKKLKTFKEEVESSTGWKIKSIFK